MNKHSNYNLLKEYKKLFKFSNMIYERHIQVDNKSCLSGLVRILNINNSIGRTIRGLAHLKHDNGLELFDPLVTRLMIWYFVN